MPVMLEVYKEQDFSKEELGMLFIAFSKRLFTRPQKGELFSSDSRVIPNGMSLNFTLGFYGTLTKEMEQAKALGKFASSNAEKEWNSLLDKLLNASDNFGHIGDDSDYYLKCSPYWS